MGFLITVINIIRKIVVAKKKIKNGINIVFNFKKIVIKELIKYAIALFLILMLLGGILYSITSSVKDAWDFLCGKYNSTDISVLHDKIGNMSEEELKAFKDKYPFMDPKKMVKYFDKETESVPYAISGTKTTNEDGNISKEQVSVDVSKLSSQYKLPWQLVGAMDIITFKAMDSNDTSVIDASNAAKSQFQWAQDVTRDETNYWKTWDVVVKDDEKKGSSVVSDGESSAQEHYKTIKTPLGLAESVDTMFGMYKYDIKRDVVLLDEPYSERQLQKKELTRTERVLDHTETKHNDDGTTEEKKHYRTVNYYTYTYKKTRNTLIEDQATGPTFTFNPTNFIRFLNGAKYKIADLKLLKLTLESLPNTNNALDMIDRIINGNYGDISDTSQYGAMGNISGSCMIPLFHQWDKAWADIPYGDHGTIRSSACGPTSAAMVLTGLQGNLAGIDTNNDGIASPPECAAYSVAHGYRVQDGTSWGYFADIGKAAGLNVREYEVSQYQQVLEELKQGHPVIASMGPGHFTSEGHFIVLVSVLPDGKIKVNDPNREECSTTPWDFTSIIVPEAKQFWAFDNPNRKSTTFLGTGYTGAADEGGSFGADGTDLLGKDLRDKLIAVDPTIIPLGSMVYIEAPANVRYQTMPDGTVVDANGYYKAVDTGSAIKGNHIDIYFGTGPGYKDICNNSWGTQNIQVYLK